MGWADRETGGGDRRASQKSNGKHGGDTETKWKNNQISVARQMFTSEAAACAHPDGWSSWTVKQINRTADCRSVTYSLWLPIHLPFISSVTHLVKLRPCFVRSVWKKNCGSPHLVAGTRQRLAYVLEKWQEKKQLLTDQRCCRLINQLLDAALVPNTMREIKRAMQKSPSVWTERPSDCRSFWLCEIKTLRKLFLGLPLKEKLWHVCDSESETLIWVQRSLFDLDLLQSTSVPPPELNPEMLWQSLTSFLTSLLFTRFFYIQRSDQDVWSFFHRLSRSYHIISYTNTTK